MTADERFDRIDDQIAEIRKDIAELRNYTLDFRTAVIGHFEKQDKQLEFMGTSMSSTSMSLAGLTKAVMELQQTGRVKMG